MTEVAKTTVATLMLLASSPSRLTGLNVERFAGGDGDSVVEAERRKRASPATVVAHGPPDKPEAQQTKGRQACSDALNAGRDYHLP